MACPKGCIVTLVTFVWLLHRAFSDVSSRSYVFHMCTYCLTCCRKYTMEVCPKNPFPVWHYGNFECRALNWFLLTLNETSIQWHLLLLFVFQPKKIISWYIIATDSIPSLSFRWEWMRNTLISFPLLHQLSIFWMTFLLYVQLEVLGSVGPQLLVSGPLHRLMAIFACLTLSFVPFGRSGRVTHTTTR